jgi:hypothetical protein
MAYGSLYEQPFSPQLKHRYGGISEQANPHLVSCLPHQIANSPYID